MDLAALIFQRAEAARTGATVTNEMAVRMVTERLAWVQSWLLLAGRTGLVGMAIAMPAREDDGRGAVIPGRMHLSTLAVDPDHWGMGVGRGLVRRALVEAHRRGCREVQLWTHLDNVRAQRLYSGEGFYPTGRTKVSENGEDIALYVHDAVPM